MWQIYTFVVHVLLLCSIAMIYFQSTLVKNLEPQSTMRQLGFKPPADRLVVFLTDGLRAKSFFKKNCSMVPHLQELFLEQGIIGISHCTIPTMSRPGHIAIFAGFIEDPSAALYYFKKNPTEFDTVFNRSRAAYGWGAYYITSIFQHLPTGGVPLNFKYYDHSDFTGAYKSDEWVFDHVRDFLTIEKNVNMVRQKPSSIFFCYLADLDVAGHNFKPDTKKFNKQLFETQKGIRETYELFESTFEDKRTVYLMTSDHGMSDRGTHGGQWPSQTETPFFLWGAGINRNPPHNGMNFTADSNGTQLPLYDLKQIQMASLMSALIGLPPPMNNMGILPQGYMNVTVEYAANAAFLNTLQLLAQVTSVLTRHEQGYFSEWLPRFRDLDLKKVESLKKQIQRRLTMNWFKEAIDYSEEISKLAIDCLQFYESYYRLALMFSTVASYLGWFYYIFAKQARRGGKQEKRFFTLTTVALCALGVTLVQLMILQQVPYWTTLFLMLPIPIWILALRESSVSVSYILGPLTQVLWLVPTAGFLAGVLRDSRFIIGAFLIARFGYNRHGFCNPTKKFFGWIILIGLMSIFILAPHYTTISPDKSYYVYASMITVLLRPIILWHPHAKLFWVINICILGLEVYAIHLRSTMQPICGPLHGIFWAYLVYAFTSIPFSRTTTTKGRLELICFNLCTAYTLFCTYFESIFVQLMVAEFLLGFHVHADIQRRLEKMKLEKDENDRQNNNNNNNNDENNNNNNSNNNGDGDGNDDDDDDNNTDDNADDNAEDNADDNADDNAYKPISPLKHLNQSYRYASMFLLYTFLSFFGTGHHAYISSFDPNSARLFVTNFSMMAIGSLIVMKLFIPPVIVISTMYTMCEYVRQNIRRILLCLMLICDVLSFCFFFFVQNRGHWREVRFSMATLIIVHGCVIMLMVCSFVAKLLFSGIPMAIIQWEGVVIQSQPIGNSQA